MNVDVCIKRAFVDVMNEQINTHIRILPVRLDLHYRCIFIEGEF